MTAAEVIEIASTTIGPVVDTTGAGDLYAAGFLYGYAKAMPLQRCGALGGLCAAEVISHLGARPRISLRSLASQHGIAPPQR
jgi:sugar/nucleoside kinase (ribokinase family)